MNVGTSVPCASRAATTIGGAMAVPATLVVGCVTNASWEAAPNADWLHGTVVSPGALTWNAAGPEVDPSVTSVCARPPESVTTCGVATDAPAGAVKVTVRPRTPSPSLAVTLATIGCGSWEPSSPLCPHPLTIASVVATGAKVIGVDATTLLYVFAETVTVRRTLGATMCPVASIGTATVSLVVHET